MDCCRDSEIARVPRAAAYRDTPDDDLAVDVQLLSIYAVPKGGKAQERAVVEREGKVYGLLTHAFLKLLDELSPASGSTVTATELKLQLLNNWTAICGADAAPRPEVYLPPSGEILLAAKGLGSPFSFILPATPPTVMTLELLDTSFKSIATFNLYDPAKDVVDKDAGVVSYEHKDGALKLRMKIGLYQYKVNVPSKTDTFKVDGSDGNVQL